MQNNHSAEELMEKIIELRIQLDYQMIEIPSKEIEDTIQFHAKELIVTFEELKYKYPEQFEKFIKNNPKYKPLDIISKDNSIGLLHIIDAITQDKEKTVSAIVKQVQSHEFYQWVKKNSKQDIVEVCETESDKNLYVHMSQFNLPQVKQEEIGDCIALAFTGILSDNAEFFNNENQPEFEKQFKLRTLMTTNRKYLNWDFKSLNVEDQTEQYKDRKTLYRPRGIAASKMIDSTYTDGKHLFAVLSTNNSNTSSQGAQAFEIYKTLQTNFERENLKINDGNNLEPSVIIFNNAFFCTQNPDKIEHNVGSSTEKKPGYHHLNLRTKFDNLYENKLSKNSLDKINGLTTLSMLGNNEISWPRFPHTFDICDIIYCNPITAGSDTLWLHTKFEQLKIYDNPQRSQKFFNFLLDYANEVATSLTLAKPNANEPILGEIKSSFERMVSGITRNFNSYNLNREISEEEIKKIEELNDKIMEYNINQPNQSIDPNLFSSLTVDAFKNKGILNVKIIEKRKRKFEKIKEEEKENQNFIKHELNSAILENYSQDNIFKKLDELSNYIYSNGKQGKKVKISDYLNIIFKNIEICEDNNCDYLKIPKNFNPNYNYINNFLRSSGVVRSNFNNKIVEQEKENPDLARALENADQVICDFIRQFHTQEGRLNIIEEGGTIKTVENLCNEVDKYIEIISEAKINLNYEDYKKQNPYSNTDRKNLGSYWNLEIDKAMKYDNYDNLVGILHEYLNRIENQFNKEEKVSGKSFSDLPKKIFILQSIAKDQPLVTQAVENIIERYNQLGELFDEQNKGKTKYKPKNYRIKK